MFHCSLYMYNWKHDYFVMYWLLSSCNGYYLSFNHFDSFISIEQIICNRYVRTILLKYLSFILQITGEYVHVKGRILLYWL